VINQIGKIYERPWGTYKTIEMQPGFQAKVITVNPGGSLSLQSHEHRAEHWVVVAGLPAITLDKHRDTYHVGEHIYIPKQAKHRLENHSKTPVVIIEIQVGDYLGEDDIVRYEDVYGRN